MICAKCGRHHAIRRRKQNCCNWAIRFFRSVVMLFWFVFVQSSFAQIYPVHYLDLVKIGPYGEILVAGTMGAMLSFDGGKHWTPPMQSADLKSSDERKLKKSIERIAKKYQLTWTKELRLSIPATAISPMLSVPAGPISDENGHQYACSKNGSRIKVSDNFGKTWKEFGVLEIPERTTETTRVLAISNIKAGVSEDPVPDICRNVFIVNKTPYVVGASAVYRSDDRGEHWIGVNHKGYLGEFAYPPYELVDDGKGTLYCNNMIYAEANGTVFQKKYIEFNQMQIFKSTDQGANWQFMAFSLPDGKGSGHLNTMRLLRVQDNVLYLASDSGNNKVSLYKSVGGKTLTKLLDVPSFEVATDITHVNLDIGSNGELAVIGSDSLSISRDNGLTWATISGRNMVDIPWTKTFNELPSTIKRAN